jgi:hypothetical protein
MLFGKIKGSSLVVPQHLVEDRTPDEAFVKRLKAAFGPELHVEWNPKRQRWVIEQCIAHSGPIGVHTHLCNRVYVWLVRGDDNEYMPLCERVIEKLREMETYRKYGTGEAALARFVQESKDFDKEQAYKQKVAAQEQMKYARTHNRTTWNKFWTLFRRHNMHEVH